MSLPSKRCTHLIISDSGFHRYRCEHPGKYDSGMCGIHDPAKIAARAAKRGPSHSELMYRARVATAELRAVNKTFVRQALEFSIHLHAEAVNALDPADGLIHQTAVDRLSLALDKVINDL